jgi:hypothetical protein
MGPLSGELHHYLAKLPSFLPIRAGGDAGGNVAE